MAAKHGGLGRGLDALISDTPASKRSVGPQDGGVQIPVDKIRDCPFQPRKRFAPESLEELTQSIRTHGVLQPLLLRKSGDGYDLIAGERRLRASRQAGLATVPAIVKDVSDRDALELALIENLQREDLNAIEEAEGYRRLMDQFGMTQDEVAVRVNKARATVTNALRLLTLAEPICLMLVEGILSVGHAKVLLGVEIEDERLSLARRCIAEGWSVRALEKTIASLSRMPRKPRAATSDIPAEHLRYLSDQLHRHFGTGVRIVPSRTLATGKKVKGTMEIDFHSNDELTRLLDIMGVTEADAPV